MATSEPPLTCPACDRPLAECRNHPECVMERLSAELAAMRPVVEAAVRLAAFQVDADGLPNSGWFAFGMLQRAVEEYQRILTVSSRRDT